MLTLAISAASNIWCTRESSCSVGRLEGWTSSQTGFEGGQFEIQILIGPDPTENPPQWFLFHYRHTDPHFWRGGRGSGGEEGSVFLWHVYASVVEGAPNKKIFTLPAHFLCTFSRYCHILIEQGQQGRVLKPWSPGILSMVRNNASHLVNPQSNNEITKSKFRKEEEGQWT